MYVEQESSPKVAIAQAPNIIHYTKSCHVLRFRHSHQDQTEDVDAFEDQPPLGGPLHATPAPATGIGRQKLGGVQAVNFHCPLTHVWNPSLMHCDGVPEVQTGGGPEHATPAPATGKGRQKVGGVQAVNFHCPLTHVWNPSLMHCDGVPEVQTEGGPEHATPAPATGKGRQKVGGVQAVNFHFPPTQD